MATIQLATCKTRLVVFPWLSEDVALTDFFHPLFSVCVCIYVDMSVYCPFKFQDAHSHTHTHMHTAKTDTASSRTPNHDYKLKCEELFF